MQTSKPNPKWPRRDLIRLWPLLLIMELVALCLAARHTASQSCLSCLQIGGAVSLTYFILRRLWGQHRAHGVATLLTAAPLLAAMRVLPWRLEAGYFLLLALGLALIILNRHRFIRRL